MQEIIDRIKQGKGKNPLKIGMVDAGLLAEVLQGLLDEVEALEDRVEVIEDELAGGE